MIRNWQPFAALFLICFLNTGCSGLLMGSGKPYKHLTREGVTAEIVENSLGEPIWQQNYRPPQLLKDTLEKIRGQGRTIHGITHNRDWARVATCRVYSHQGPFLDMSRGEMMGMSAGLTAGLSELVFLPTAIVKRSQMIGQPYFKTFWFDSEDRFVAEMDGDFRRL